MSTTSVPKIKDILPNFRIGKTHKDYRVARLIDVNSVIENINTSIVEIDVSLAVATAGLSALNDGTIEVNFINELTAGSGVTVDGALIKDGSFTGKQATAIATADGLTTGLLTGTDQFVSVTSAAADNIVALPLDSTCPFGTVVRGWVGANGFELRSDAADLTATMNNVTMGTTSEAAIPANTFFLAKKVATLTWVLTTETNLGAAGVIVPDAV